jgi:demethylmenaquinone methyltransferase/2-methoxy-6-polyprenyl-1,4-benzoquinol methylase
MLKQASAKSGLESVCSYSEALPFPDESFERVIMVDALHHVHHQSRSVLELWRVVKPGGLILVEEPDIHTLAVKVVAVAEKLALMRSHFLSPEAIVALFPEKRAQKEVVRDGFNAWLTIRKTA